MIKIHDGTQIKRIAGKAGDRSPQTGIKRDRAVYVAQGGETSIDLSLLSPSISFMPGMNQLTVKRSSVGDLISGLSFFERTTSMVGFPTPLVAGEWVEIIKEIEIVGVQAATARPDIYSTTASAGQTLVIADFSWTYNLNQTKAVGGCEVYLHGILQARGVDYYEVNLGTESTNQIQFVDPLVGGENIVIKPTYQVIDQSAAASTFYGQQINGIQAAIAAVAESFNGIADNLSFVGYGTKIDAPFTTVTNRAQLPDITADLKASFGIERIAIKGVYPLQGETGPAGQLVFGGMNDDRGLVRFVGGGWSTVGSYAYTPTMNDYVEIVFYGTGLNILVHAANYSRDLRVSIDGGQEGSNIYNHNSNVLSGRNYSPNVVCQVASGLTFGLHSAKIRLNSSSTDFTFYGFEVINASSTQNINVNTGSAYNNGVRYLGYQNQAIPYNGEATGSKGGRSALCLKPDGTIYQAFTPVSQNTLYMSASDHSAEEISRIYYPREFGAGRNDDFSLLTSGSTAVAFTLADGTTSLYSQTGSITPYYYVPSGRYTDGVRISSSAGNTRHLSFVFVGTGIDIELLADGTTRQFDNIYVDDVVITTSLIKTGSTAPEVVKLASGLPYGTHIVKFSISGAQTSPGISRFIVYASKKPAIPDGYVEVADYNVMADYVANTSGTVAPSQGVLKKTSTREVSYSGAWAIPGIDASFSTGSSVRSSAAGSYFEYTFFGTGIEHKTLFPASSSIDCSYSIDDSSNLSSYQTGIYGSNVGSLTFSPANGSVTGTTSSADGYGTTVKITNLPLGTHKLRVTFNTAVNGYCDSLDIITPIHSADSSMFEASKGNQDVGSNAISDSRRTSILKESLIPNKGFAQVSSTDSTSITTSSFIPCKDLSCTIKTNGGPVQINYSINASFTSTTVGAVVYVDGVRVSKQSRSGVTSFLPALSTSSGTYNTSYPGTGTAAGTYSVSGAVNGNLNLPSIPINTIYLPSIGINVGSITNTIAATIADSLVLKLAPGFHKIDIYWYVNSGSASGTERNLSVVEL